MFIAARFARRGITLLFLFPLFLFISAFAVPAYAQDVDPTDHCSGGMYYVLAFPDTTANTWDSRFPAQLIRTNTKAFNFYIYSPVDQTLEVSGSGGKGVKVRVSAGQIMEYSTEQIGIPLVTAHNTPVPNTVSIRAEYPIIVYGYMLTAYSAEAYTAIPVDSWGTEYYTAQWPGQIVRNVSPNGEFNYKAIPKEAPAEILIIAAYDGTQVKINPTADLLGCNKCTEVTLKAGEAYLVQSIVDTAATAVRQGDLTGTFIQSNKPIGVVSGNTRLMHNAGVRPSLAENSPKNIAFEWMPPVEQHGTEFVFLPMWDDRRQREGLDLEESRANELVRILATSPDKETEKVAVRWYSNVGSEVPAVKDSLLPGEFTQEKLGLPMARYYKATGPAFAISSPESVVKFNGTTTYGAGYVGASYLSWGTHMVELVPREQWTSFAPVRAPSLPSSMVHYLNLATDSSNQFNVYYRQGNSPAQLFPFNRGVVPGSDLVWGSIPLNKGVDYFIEGKDGARFTGYAYGSYRGQEQHRPGGAKEGDEGKRGSISSGGGNGGDPLPLHPSEYEEDIALMYGYPLAPSRCPLGTLPDDYEITFEQHCDVMEITIRAKNAPAAGIRSVSLRSDSNQNARLEFISPSRPEDLAAGIVTEVRVRVTAINPLNDANGTITVRDRARDGAGESVEYHWKAEIVDLAPAELNFGDVTVDSTSGEQMITITNPRSDRRLVVKSLAFILGTQGFTISRLQPSFNYDGTDSLVIEPADSLRIWITVTPPAKNSYLDSLRVQFGCRIVTTPVRGRGIEPSYCLQVSDLDFGVLEVDKSRTLDLEICNRGEGAITFTDPWLTWLKDLPAQQGFNVQSSEIDRLKGAVLNKDECVTIRVTFYAGDTGTFRTTARFWANTRSCRDTSIWRARGVDFIGGVAGDNDREGYGIAGAVPNPFTQETRIDFRLGRSGQTVVEVYNGAGERIATLLDERLSAGEHSVVWDARGEAAGAYHVRIRSGEWSGTRQLILLR